MSSINQSSSADRMSTNAMVAFVTPEHDAGLCHEHGWARDAAVERRAYPRVANAALVTTPSCATHDDIHYAS